MRSPSWPKRPNPPAPPGSSWRIYALLVCPLLVMAACQRAPLPGGSQGQLPEEGSTLQMPPGAADPDAPPDYERLRQSAAAMEKARRFGEALRLYARAAAAAPDDVSPDQREALQARIKALSFSLGVQDSSPSSAPATGSAPGWMAGDGPPAGVDATANATRSEGLKQAHEVYAGALKAEKAGQLELARTGYTQVRQLIREQDDAELYWNAWQRLEDLKPEAPEEAPRGPAPLPRGFVMTKSPSSAATPEPGDDGSSAVGGDGSIVAGDDGSTVAGTRATEVMLGRARQRYMEGMGFVRTKDRVMATAAFTEVLSLIDETQDPELVRAARQNLLDLKQQPSPSTDAR